MKADRSILELPVLYTIDKDKRLRLWKIWTEDNIIFTEYGLDDGALQKAEKEIIEGTNIGKKNERNPIEQAQFIAKADWKKRRDKDHFEDKSSAQDSEIITPMLANTFSPEKTKIEYPVAMQPKLNGARCLSHIARNDVILKTRQDKQYEIKAFDEYIKKLLENDKGLHLDGELYVHGLDFQDIISDAKKYDKNSYLEYHIYDIYNPLNKDMTFSERNKKINKIFQDSGFYSESDCLIKQVETIIVNNLEELKKQHIKFCEMGYEGSIIRDLKGVYVLNNRTKYLLKYKDFIDDDYEIIGFREGIGKFKGCCIYKCKTKDGLEFEVTPKGSIEAKQEMYINAPNDIGKFLKVKYQNLSKDGIPIFPVGLCIRMDGDLTNGETT